MPQQNDSATRIGCEWEEYYDEFSYFWSDLIRPGCHPWLMKHDQGARDGIVLVHGLSDSPYYMKDLGEFFHQDLGYNVYLPLLHMHGLRDANGMEGVDLKQWKANVRHALYVAEDQCERVSVGGLSTGGALSFLMSATEPMASGITGAIYLFSAALDLAGGPMGVIGEMKQWLVTTFLADIFDDNSEKLAGDRPYRYSRVDLDGAEQLARLIRETDEMIDAFDKKHPFRKRTFAAHAKADRTAAYSGVESLKERSSPDTFELYACPAWSKKDPHASVVLKHAIPAAGGKEPDEANPHFGDMTARVKQFASKHGLLTA